MAVTGDQLKSAGTVIVTGLVVLLVTVWTVVVLLNLGVEPKYDTTTGTLIIDKYTRAKDILTLVFPLATVAVGYWLGSEGKAKSEEKAKSAEGEKAVAQQQALAAQHEVVDASAKVAAIRTAIAGDPSILQRAQEIYGGEL